MTAALASKGLVVGEPLPDSIAGASVLDRARKATRLRALCEGRAVLISFLRHFGCIGCSESLAELAPRLPELASLGVRVVLVGCGAPEFIDGFLERFNLVGADVEVYTDPTLAIHAAAGLRYGLWENFGPRGLLDLGRAFAKGHVNGPPEGDGRQQAGVVFVDATGIVQLVHRNRSLGDHAPPQRIVDAALASFARGRGA
jgi:hypothetical protein